jgi:hypothetical protein
MDFLSARFRDVSYEAVWCSTLKRTMGAPLPWRTVPCRLLLILPTLAFEPGTVALEAGPKRGRLPNVCDKGASQQLVRMPQSKWLVTGEIDLAAEQL